MRARGPEETLRAGSELGARLKPGSIVCLYGELGAGKTTFVKGIASALGMDPQKVISASFTVIAEYPTSPALYHIDLYRIAGEEDLESTGIYDVLDSGGICVIEWAERIELEGAISVRIGFAGDDEREIVIEESQAV